MIINSKFSSLWLGKKEQWKAPQDQDVCYIQKYAIGEEIRIQFTGFVSKFTAKYISQEGAETPLDVELLYTDPNDSKRRLFQVAFSVDTEGIYTLAITSGIDEVYSSFCIKPIEELEDTILINYTHRKNEYDTRFVNDDGTYKRFNFRIDGGIHPADKAQAIDNEIFRDQRFAPFQTAAEGYEISTLTIGTKRGVPQWVGNRINHIFKCSDVLVDDIETVRNEGSIPELAQVGAYYPLYVFKLKVEQSDKERLYTEGLQRLFTITFHGNGGETEVGEIITTIEVPSGTVWRDIDKPSFAKPGTASTHSGFGLSPTATAAIAPDFVVNEDIDAYALYDVVEVGVITAAGEVMSADGWIEKYGAPYWSSTSLGAVFSGNKENQVHFIYFKISEAEKFALSVRYRRDDGSQVDSIGAFAAIGCEDRDMSPYGVRVYDSQRASQHASPWLYPKLHKPTEWDYANPANLGAPQSVIDEIMSIKSGKVDSYNFLAAAAGYTSSSGVIGSPLLEEVSSWRAGDIISENSFYIASPYQVDVIFKNKQKILDIIDTLSEWSDSIAHHPFHVYYAYWADDPGHARAFADLRSVFVSPIYPVCGIIRAASEGMYDADTRLLVPGRNTYYVSVAYDIAAGGIRTTYDFPGFISGIATEDHMHCALCDVNHLF